MATNAFPPPHISSFLSPFFHSAHEFGATFGSRRYGGSWGKSSWGKRPANLFHPLSFPEKSCEKRRAALFFPRARRKNKFMGARARCVGFLFPPPTFSGGAEKSRERKLALNFATVGCCSNYTKYGLRGTTVRGLFLLRPRQVGGDRGGRRRGSSFPYFLRYRPSSFSIPLSYLGKRGWVHFSKNGDVLAERRISISNRFFHARIIRGGLSSSSFIHNSSVGPPTIRRRR